MITGTYILTVKCDTRANFPKGHLAFPKQFLAQTASQCRQQARRDGWLIDHNKGYGYALCPQCRVQEFTK